MKINGPRFSLPACIFSDNLPPRAFILLVYLFSESSVAGRVAPGYQAMKAATRTTTDATICSCLKLLRKHGWFDFVKKSNGRNAVYWLKIPDKYTRNEHAEVLKIRMFPRKQA
jgi:hypothetical protein